MVAVTLDNNQDRRFVIRPNRSISWEGTKRLFLVMMLLSMVIAFSFGAVGFWPVIPFAGLELLALGLAFYLCARRCHWSEVVSIRPHCVEVEKGRHGPEERWLFPRAWAKVELLVPFYQQHPSKLVIRSHGREVELGAFLNERERRALASDLRRAIGATL
ncbi:MAG: DUF2244 domain-containing protein [Gammaproteobacteria bacterium]|jgi:uncharacterized membrane protein